MIGSIIDYNPQVDSYQDEVTRIVNEIYLQFFTSHPWKFSQKSIDVYTHPDVTDASATIVGSAQDDKLPVNTITLSSNAIMTQDNRQGQIRREGDVIVLNGSAEQVNNGLFILDKWDNGVTLNVSKYSEQARVHWEGNGSETVSIEIQQRYLKLPADCVGILSVGIKNLEEASVGTNALGHTYPLTRREEEELNLRDDFTGTPTTWIPYDQPPDTVSRHVRDFIPRKGKDFTVNIASTPGQQYWPEGTYEFKVAYQLHNEVGPSSDAVSVTVSKFEVPTFEFYDTTKLGWNGLNKRIYFRIVSANGLDGNKFEEKYFRDLGSFLRYPASADYTYLQVEDNATTWDFPYTESWWSLDTVEGLCTVPRERQYLDNHWRIRLFPRPATQTPMRIRYMYYPQSLQDDYDTPESPVDTHRYLVYRACQELFIKHKNDNQALYYEKKADEEMRKIEKRYLTERAAYYIKGAIRSGPMRLKPYRDLSHLVGKDGK